MSAPKRMRRNNLIRAAWAECAAQSFAEQTGQDRDFAGGNAEALGEVVGDLLADLMHYADAQRLDFDALLDTARMNYDAEQSASEDSFPLDGEPMVRAKAPRRRVCK